MLQIFSKKQFLKDLLEDFVDIHNHILPGIDDGAKNVKESIDLIKKLNELGVKEFISTPHIMEDFYSNTNTTIKNAHTLLLKNLNEELIKGITINPAAEYMLDNEFENLLQEGNLLTLKRNYVLIEISYLQPPINLETLIYNIKIKGYLPVLAHPERYAFYHNNLDYYKALKQLGCFFQLNLLSLSDYYGTNVEKTANYLINKKLIDFVATDTHNTIQIEKLSNLVLNKKTIEKMSYLINNTNNIFSIF